MVYTYSFYSRVKIDDEFYLRIDMSEGIYHPHPMPLTIYISNRF